MEQLSDQENSEDFLIMRGTALGYGLLNDIGNRDKFIRKFVETPHSELHGTELAREIQARAAGLLLLGKEDLDLLDNAKEIFETELEKALPNLPDDIAIDIATEPLKMARQARSGLMENAFLRKEWKTCVNEAEHARSLIPDYLLYQPHREGYPIEFVARGMDTDNLELVSKGVEMQEEFLQYVIDVGYLKPWEDSYFTSYAISVISRAFLD